MPELTAPEAEESREHNLQSTEYMENMEISCIQHAACKVWVYFGFVFPKAMQL